METTRYGTVAECAFVAKYRNVERKFGRVRRRMCNIRQRAIPDLQPTFLYCSRNGIWQQSLYTSIEIILLQSAERARRGVSAQLGRGFKNFIKCNTPSCARVLLRVWKIAPAKVMQVSSSELISPPNDEIVRYALPRLGRREIPTRSGREENRKRFWQKLP